MGKKIKVAISVTLEVDSDGWVQDYGTRDSGVRDDVKAYLHSLLNESNENLTVVKLK